MSVQTKYPGVYITEIPSGSRSIVGVATSITAFVGSAARGPENTPTTIFSFGDFERAFGGLSKKHALAYLVRDFYLNGGGEAVIVRVSNTGTGVTSATASGVLDSLTLDANGSGEWGNALRGTVTHLADATAAADVAASQGVTANDLFDLTIADSAPGGETEVYRNVTVVDGPRRLDLVLASSRLVTSPTLPLPLTRPNEVPATAFTGGADGDGIDAADYVGDENHKTGIWALLKADLVNLVCLAPPGVASDVPATAWQEAAKYCDAHRAFLVVDMPAATDTTGAATTFAGTTLGISGTVGRNAAVYFPRLRYADPLRGGAISDFPASGAIAGTIARTDAQRGVWKAPAGTEAGLNGVNGLSVTLTDNENGELNPLGINCLRTFRGVGSVVWGARTLRGSDVLADEYKYIPVRRLALFLEETLYRNTQWVVFEPNDEPLWAEIRASVGAFMQDLFRRGAFQGASPRDAYFVHCDSDTTTQYDIDRGVVNIRVGFAPLKPAEFVVIGIQQKAASATA